MKAWTSAEVSGRCAYDPEHTWQAGERIYRLQGATWLKDFCADCGKARHQAPDDTGEVLDLESAPTYPASLTAVRELIHAAALPERFDARMAAANDGPDPNEPAELFDEPFEEPPC